MKKVISLQQEFSFDSNLQPLDDSYFPDISTWCPSHNPTLEFYGDIQAEQSQQTFIIDPTKDTFPRVFKITPYSARPTCNQENPVTFTYSGWL